MRSGLAASMRGRSERPAGNGSHARLNRWIGRALIALIVGTVALIQVPLTSGVGASAAPVSAPEVFSILGRNQRMVHQNSELRVQLVLKVPSGYVNAETGRLQQVNGSYLRVGYDYDGETTDGSKGMSLRHVNGVGRTGAEEWVRNSSEAYTVHQVIPSGENDYLVMSIQAYMTPVNKMAGNVPGGRETQGNLYFSFERSSAPSPSGATDNRWITSALTRHPLPYRLYYYSKAADNIVGPVMTIQKGREWSLWSGSQASYGQVLDYGLAGNEPGIVPANAIGASVVNFATQSVDSGPAGSVSTSFWYAWVHEDNTLVTEINSAPIRVTGLPATADWQTDGKQVAKNTAQVPGQPSLGRTVSAAEQGLSTRVSAEGTVDVRGVGGSGFYRLLAWPEAEDPKSVQPGSRAQSISYHKEDLFNGNIPTARALDQSWMIGSAFYQYGLPRPRAPKITAPVADTATSENRSIVFSGTGIPGHSITLKLMSGGAPITGPNSTGLETIVNGERSCNPVGCEVMVQPDRSWSYTYTPQAPLADGSYGVVAMQTEQSNGTHTTSALSNPNRPENPTEWGVRFAVDRTAANAPALACPVRPVSSPRPMITGSGVEDGASVEVSLDGRRVGEAQVTGTNWSYEFAEDLDLGAHRIAVMQTDRAGNASAWSDPACRLVIAPDVEIVGKHAVLDVQYPAANLISAAPENWEAFVSDGGTEQIISGGAPVRLERNLSYRIGKRVRSTPESDPTAHLYVQTGDPVCTDGAGAMLPSSIYVPELRALEIPEDADITGPITCTFSKQASHTSLVVKRLGGQTVIAGAGWKLTGNPIDDPEHTEEPKDGFSTNPEGMPFTLEGASVSAVTRPGEYDLGVDAPDGLRIIGFERLDRSDPGCAANASTPENAPEHCWVRAETRAMAISQGAHEVFRAVATELSDVPTLPFTGGWGSWAFIVGGAGAFALATAAAAAKGVRRMVNARAERKSAQPFTGRRA